MYLSRKKRRLPENLANPLKDEYICIMERFLERTWIQQLILWSILIVGILIATDYPSLYTPGQVHLDQMIIVIMLMCAAYSNNFWVLPFFYQNKPMPGILLYILNVGVFVALHRPLTIFLHKRYCQYLECVPPAYLIPIKSVFALVVLVTFSAMALRITRDSLLQQAQNKDAELKLLHSQLNPHFLFNTLNNLFGLAVQKSNKLPELMMQLSDLLRYSMYDTQAERVPLEKELIYIQNYVALERIRLEDKTQIELEMEGEVSQQEIAPMMLIVFLENAFKHLGSPKGKRGEVFISLKVQRKTLVFNCKNSVSLAHNLDMDLPKYQGIGLQNVQKRLALIYPRRHTLSLEANDHYFTVHLTLRL